MDNGIEKMIFDILEKIHKADLDELNNIVIIENDVERLHMKKQDGKDNSGIYKLTFHTSPYFKSLGQKSFYPFIEVVFELVDNEHYHVPITLSPFGYSTYRGN